MVITYVRGVVRFTTRARLNINYDKYYVKKELFLYIPQRISQ